MALTVITGSANAGKTGRAYETLRAAIAQGHEAALLLPSAPDVTRALQELAPSAPLGLTVDVLDRYLDHLWSAHGDGRSIVEPAVRAALLAKCGNTLGRDDLPTDIPLASMLRVAARLAERVAESSERVRPDAAIGTGRWLARVLEAYGRELSDAGLIERAAAHRLLSGSLDARMVPAALVVNRFTGFRPAQEAFLLAAAHFSAVTVSLTFDVSVPATQAAAGVVDRLGAHGTVINVTPSAPYTEAPELYTIEHRLGVAPQGPGLVPAGDVVLSESWGEEGEAACIAREIQIAQTLGIGSERIAVVFRDPAGHAAALRRALAEAAISADWDLRLPLSATGLGRAVLRILDLGDGETTRSLLMDVLRSPYSAASDDGLDEIDARLRGLRRLTVGRATAVCAAVHAPAARYLHAVREALRALGAGKAHAVWHPLLMRMLSQAHGSGILLDADGRLDAAAAREVLSALAGLQATGPDEAISVSRLGEVLRAAAVSIASEDRPDHVQIMSAERIRGRRFECVILGGLTADEFPRTAREDALSAPDVARALERAGIDPPARIALDDERLLFYQTVTRASRRLVLSAQSHRADGTQRRRSVFVEELLDLYRDEKTGQLREGGPERRVLGPGDVGLSSGAPVSMRREMQEAARSGSPTPEVWRDRVAGAQRRARPDPPVLSSSAIAELAGRETFSASEIETYIQGPYRWYIERVVRPKAVAVAVDTAAAGRLAHDVLRRFYEEFAERTGRQRVTPDALADARAIHAEVVDAALRGVRPFGVAEEVRVRSAARTTLGLIEADAEWLPWSVPEHLEWSFGLGPDDAPEPFGDFSLAGRIDRVDVGEGRLVVIDYKSATPGSGMARAKLLEHGLVQLPLYAAVASRRLALSVGGAVYRGIAGTRPRGFVHDELAGRPFYDNDVADADTIDALIQATVERAAEAVAGMRSGNIAPDPLKGTCPSYCAARAVCQGRGDYRA
jgi:RecB family exonuclease